MRDFDLVVARDLPGALEALVGNDGSTRPLAGGTDMIVNIRAGLIRPRLLVALGQVGDLCEIRREDGRIRVGAGVNVAHFLKHPVLIENADIVRQSAAKFANPMIRNLATVGGNLASASPAADLAPALLALGAEVELTSKSGTRILPLEDFLVGPRKTALRGDELITALTWQVPPANSAAAFYKLGLRQADAISVISVAVTLEREGDRCRSARIAMGAVAPRPMRAHRAESALVDQPIREALLSEAASIASEECNPIDDLRGSAAYRRRMVRVYVGRMLAQAWAGAKDG
jgi:aerobic carbon-monoxide dehydrogenase medium subunit